ncbi:MAG: chitobiase/beta-hexosaminidase C-terminal domain-containing protein [Verrucomicrobiae bacterium]|nr:chitobiase/beta-hexosaminidase C-terminal domain-containing protein [Verrucomicrobiae bacterium]
MSASLLFSQEPEVWQDSDVGSVGVAGSSSYDEISGVFTVRGSGADITSTKDAFHFVSRTLTGNFTLVARVVSVQSTHAWAKAGVMIREGAAANARHVFMALTPGNGLTFQRRVATGRGTSVVSGGSAVAPRWVKLTRLGSSLSAYSSVDGISWEYVGGTTIVFSSSVEAGLAVCSHLNTALCEAQMDHVSVESLSSVGAPWSSQDVGLTGLSGAESSSNGVYTVAGAGKDIGATNDAFRIVSQPLEGDGQIVAQVLSVHNGSTASKAGIMLRENMVSNACHAAMLVTPSGGVYYERRVADETGTLASGYSTVTLPYWLKLIRSGNVFSGYRSEDGVNWTLMGTNSIGMAASLNAGLVVCSRSTNSLSVAEMDSVNVLPGAVVDTQAPSAPTGLVAAAQSDTWVSLRWEPSSDNVGIALYQIYRDGVKIASTSLRSYVDTARTPSQTHVYTLKARDGAGNVSALSEPLSVTLDPATLLFPWAHQDVGSVKAGGSATVSNGVYTVCGDGSNIGGTSDSFHYAYVPLSGDGEFVAQVGWVDNTHAEARAGVMVRETLKSNSRHFFVGLTPTNGTWSVSRVVSGGDSVSVSGGKVGKTAMYFRVKREGDVFSGYQSEDGVNWSMVDSQSMAMVNHVYVGLAVNSHKSGILNRSFFDSVSMPGGDMDWDGMPDAWETQYFYGLERNGAGDFDQDGVNDLLEYRMGTDPTDYYNGVLPVLSVAGANPQVGTTNAWLVSALTVKVANAAGKIMKNAPVNFTVAEGGAQLSVSTNGAPMSSSLGVCSGTNGLASVWCLMPGVAGSQRVTAAAASGSQSVGVEFQAQASAGGWESRDLGSVGKYGGATLNETSGEATVKGSGSDIASIRDAGHFLSKVVSGDFEAVARVMSMDATHAWAKAGLMARESLEKDSRNVFMALTPGNGLRFQYRANPAAGTSAISGGAADAPRWVKLRRLGRHLSGYASVDGVNWTFVGGATLAVGAELRVGLAVSSHNNAQLCEARFSGLHVETLAGWSSPWIGGNVGTPGVGGAGSVLSDGTLAVVGAGTDIGGTGDQGYFVGQPLAGDVQIVARVGWMQNTSAAAKAGVMIRDGMESNAVYSAALVTPNYGVYHQRRVTAGGATSSGNLRDFNAPAWVKLIRTGNVFQGYGSVDGVNWTLAGTNVMTVSSSAQVGLVVCSRNTNVLNLSLFDSLSVTPGTVNDTQPPAVPSGVALTAKSDTWATIRWDASSDDVGIAAYQVYRDGVKIASTAQRSYTDVGRNPGQTYAYTIKAQDAAGHVSGASAAFNVTLDAASLPDPWKHGDVGSVTTGGTATLSNGVFTVRGAGSEIGGKADSFHYAYVPMSGDGEFVAQVTWLDNTHTAAKAGVMIRENLNANARQMFVGLTPTNGTLCVSRLTAGGAATNVVGNAQTRAPQWVKVSRAGNVLSGYQSTDGLGWTLVNSQTITMTNSVLAGLAVCSRNTSALNQAYFDHAGIFVDADGNGLPDDWEQRYFGATGTDPNADPDGDGRTNLQEYQMGSDPNDYFNGVLPTLTKVGGDGQTGKADQFLVQPLQVLLATNGVPLIDAPVTFNVTQGGALLAVSSNATAFSSSLGTRTDTNGMASAFCLMPPAFGSTNLVSATVAGGTNSPLVVFSEIVANASIPPASGMKLWLKADAGVTKDSSNLVSQWADQSGQGNHAVQTSSGAKPTLVSAILNGQPVVRFNGSGNFLSVGTPASMDCTNLTFFAMMSFRSTSGNQAVFSKDVGGGSQNKWIYWYTSGAMCFFVYPGSGSVYSTAFTPQVGSFNRWTLVKNGSQYNYFRDGAAFGGGTCSVSIPVINSDFRIGQAEGNFWFNGDIAETLVYDRPLTTAECQQVEQYLTEKYNAPTVSQPVFSVDSGRYLTSRSVAITCADPIARIYYTTDGREPTESDPLVASGSPVTINSGNAMLRAKAFRTGCLSSVKSAAYQIGPQVAAGYLNGLALQTNGVLWSWGDNARGQLGDGQTMNRCWPQEVSGINGVVGMAGGAYHAVAVKNDGTVWGWGSNDQGQLGLGDNTQRNAPAQLSLIGVCKVTTRAYHNLALKNDGTVWAWGQNSWGALGDGTTTDRNAPVQVTGLTNCVNVAAGYGFNVALKGDGRVWTWGRSDYGRLGLGSVSEQHQPVQISGLYDVAAIAAGAEHALALKGDGTVWAWGSGAYGQIGDGAFAERWTPVQVSGLTDVVAIAAGQYHSMAVKRDGTVWMWGNNDQGQLGDGTTTRRNTPTQVSSLSGVVSLAGGTQSLVLKSDGSFLAWGSNDSGQLGVGDIASRNAPTALACLTFAEQVACPVFSVEEGSYLTAQTVTISCATPEARIYYTLDGREPTESDVLVNNGGTVVINDGARMLRAKAFKNGILPSMARSATYRIGPQVVAGCNHSFALKADGMLFAWGYNEYGELGNGLEGMSGVAGVDGGDSHSVAVKGDGTAWTWGYNVYGQLGLGDAVRRSAPEQVSGLSGIRKVAAGSTHTLALKEDGTVWVWGRNNRLQLGDGTNVDHNVPVAVSGLSGVVAVDGGDEFCAAVKRDGTVWTWGRYDHGRLGIGATSGDHGVPVQVGGIFDVVTVSCGLRHVVALKADGTVWAWGNGNYGQVGDGTWENRDHPVKASGLTDVVAIAAGQYHSLALKRDGTVWAWGYNLEGQLGDGTTTYQNAPKQVSGLSGVTSLSGGTQSLALKPWSGVNLFYGWGANGRYQLLDGTHANRLAPVLMMLPFDSDHDGLMDWEEFIYGTDPLNPDTNGDGFSDDVILLGINPANLDADGDGMLNASELLVGTDPFKADTDGDGVPDGLDAYPLDSSRWIAPEPDPNDHTLPVIILTKPLNAELEP